MIPLVEPPELEPILAEAKSASRPRASRVSTCGRGRPANEIVEAAKDRGPADRDRLAPPQRLARILGADVATAVKRDAGCDVIVAD